MSLCRLIVNVRHTLKESAYVDMCHGHGSAACPSFRGAGDVECRQTSLLLHATLRTTRRSDRGAFLDVRPGCPHRRVGSAMGADLSDGGVPRKPHPVDHYGAGLRAPAAVIARATRMPSRAADTIPPA